MRFNEFFSLFLEEHDYRGAHQAPTYGENSAPLWNLNEIYPDDIYSSKAIQYYGDGSGMDRVAINIMQSYRNKPNKSLIVYRAIPVDIREKEIKNINDEINLLERKPFPYVEYSKMIELEIKSVEEYRKYLYKKLENVKNLMGPKISINHGDWVTTVKKYAVDHGKSALNGKYKILQKTVFARDLFTDGNSVFEFGYDPQQKAINIKNELSIS